jgi:hypothetical protein
MDAANPFSAEPPFVAVSELPLDPTSTERTVTLRDDRLDFPGLLDAASSCRRRDARLRIVDQGRLSVSELEWLGEAGAGIYSSDRARRDAAEFVLIRKATQRGGAAAAVFHHGAWTADAAASGLPYETLRELGRSGLDLHVSDKVHARDAVPLAELAYDCRRGGAVFVLYHHGPLSAGHEELAGEGIWIHLSSNELTTDEDVRLLGDCARSARRAGSNVVLHIECTLNAEWMSDIVSAGTAVLFKTPPSDYRSPLRPFEDAARGRRLDSRAFYLFTDFVL